MDIEFKRLPEIEKSKIIDLMNNGLVRKQMPLFTRDFDDGICEEFITSKELLWTKHGYGPWAFTINNEFVGWGGLKPENGEADLALVLHPNYWGKGKHIYKKIIKQAFGVLELTSITVLFPRSRTRVQGLLCLGFVKEKELNIDGVEFIKYRLTI